LTTDKASENLALLRTFKRSYKEKYNTTIFSLDCIAYTFNNVVSNVLNWLLPTKKDKELVVNTINSEQLEEEEEEDSRELVSGKFF